MANDVITEGTEKKLTLKQNVVQCVQKMFNVESTLFQGWFEKVSTCTQK